MHFSHAAAAGIFAGTLAAIIFTNHPASAQSPYSYPWCAKLYLRGTATSCYYANRDLCMATVSGIGGYCYLNPAYNGGGFLPPRHYRYRWS